MNNYTKNNTSNYIWDSPDYPWNEDLGLDMLKVEYDKQLDSESRSKLSGLRLPSTHQSSSEIAGFMKNRAKKTGMPLMAQNQLNTQASNATNNSMGNSPQISSVTNGDGSISITRERQANNNGIMQTQTGNIRLKPQDSANGAAATLTPSMREKLLGLSESVGGKTVDVSSGIRTKGQNDWLRKKNIRTAKNSQHVIGSAADININNNGSQTASDAYHSNNFGRVNIYKDGSVHVDDMPRPTGSMGFYRDWQRVGDKTPRDKPTPPKKRK